MEWMPASLWGSPYAFDLLLYGAALAMVLSWWRARLACHWLLAGAFAAASLTAFRNEMLIGVLAPILIADYFPWKRGLATDHLEPGRLGANLGGGGGPFSRGGLPLIPETRAVAICVIVAWLVGWTALGAWRMMTREA